MAAGPAEASLMAAQFPNVGHSFQSRKEASDYCEVLARQRGDMFVSFKGDIQPIHLRDCLVWGKLAASTLTCCGCEGFMRLQHGNGADGFLCGHGNETLCVHST